eukprot:5806497-Heterocapsa_arctica.AAC.1
MEGRSDTPWDFEHMAGQRKAKTPQKPQPQGPGRVFASLRPAMCSKPRGVSLRPLIWPAAIC